MPALIDIIPQGKRVDAHRPWPRLVIKQDTCRVVVSKLAASRTTLFGLWGDADVVPWVHMAIIDDDAGDVAVVSLACPDGVFPSVGALQDWLGQKALFESDH
jgi:hypothetical protein